MFVDFEAVATQPGFTEQVSQRHTAADALIQQGFDSFCLLRPNGQPVGKLDWRYSQGCRDQPCSFVFCVFRSMAKRKGAFFHGVRAVLKPLAHKHYRSQ